MADSFSTKVSGDQVSDYCKMQAAYLCKLIYRFPQGSQGFSTSFPEEIAKAAANWDIWEDFNKQDECGFVARLFKPKGYDPHAKDDGQMCWPTFVFRGTDFDDFRGLGVVFNFTWPGLNETLNKAAETLKKHIQSYTDEADKRLEEYNEMLRYSGEEFPPPANEIIHGAVGHEALNILNNINLEEILASILNQPRIFEADRNNPGKKAEYKPEQWEVAVEGQLTGSLDFGGLGERAQAVLDFKIIVRKEKNFGDWATNLLQGVGVHTRAYEYAMQYAYDVMYLKIRKTQQKQITFAGHSLGGGLATTANYAAHNAAINTNAQIYGIVFNPAGVNDQTYKAAAETGKTGSVPQSYKDRTIAHVGELAARYKNMRDSGELNKNFSGAATRSSFSGALVDLYRVNGEILTQLGLYPQQIPFILGAMKLLQTGFPRPVGTVFTMHPIVPIKDTKDVTPSALDNQPDFTVPSRSEIGNELKKAISEAQEKLRSVDNDETQQQYQNALRRYNNFVYSGDPDIQTAIPNPHNIYLFFKPGTEHPLLFPIDKQLAIPNTHHFKNILQLSEMLANYQTMEKFLSDLIDFLDENVFNSLLKPILSLLKEDSNVDIRSLLWSSAWEGIKYISGFGGIKRFKTEVEDLIQLFAISADFHGMDYVIASLNKFLADKKEQEERVRRAQAEENQRRAQQDYYTFSRGGHSGIGSMRPR